MYIKLNDINLYYEKHGNKKQEIIILPGWGDNRKTFYYLINYLKDYFTIYIMDYPGFGNSKFPDKDLTIYDYKELIIKFIKKLKIKNPIIIAHSFGGRITSLLVKEIKVKKLLLISVAGIKKINLKIILKTRLYKTLKLLKYLLPKSLKKKYLDFLFNLFASNDYKDLNPNIKKTFQNIIKVDLKNNYKSIKQETLILWGTLDNITPLNDGILINKLIKNSTLIKLNNCYHFSYLEQKYLVTRIIYEYLKKDSI